MKKIIILLFITIGVYATEMSSKDLSTDLRSLLSQEMKFIKSGMDEMLYAIVSNDFKKLNEIAGKIEHSYILKKKLTKKQKQEIKQKLSIKFMKFDQEFHDTAQELSSFAEFDDRENILQTYSNMIKQCIRCHESFATHRFTNFETE